jgi:outer membrane protein TolC
MATDLSGVWQSALQKESSLEQDEQNELFDQVAISYFQAMLAQDNFRAAHAQVHAVVLQRNFLRLHFFNGKDLNIELARSRARLGTLLAQWVAAREQLEQQRNALSALTQGRISQVSGASFAYSPPPLSSNSIETKLVQKTMQLNQPESGTTEVSLDVLRLYQAVQNGDAKLAAHQTALHWSLQALEGISRAQDAAEHPHSDMLEAMATVQQNQFDLFKTRYDSLYQRLRLCAEAGMPPEAIAAHIDNLIFGLPATP